MSMPKALRFGIQSLDKLIGTFQHEGEETYGINLSEPEEDEISEPDEEGLSVKVDSPITSSVCLTGPDGTGKSVFSLHIASRYLADCTIESELSACPKVFYISTDLTYEMALKAWTNFALNFPSQRREPLIELSAGRRGERGGRIKLTQYFPSGDDNPETKSIVNYVEGVLTKSEVCFVDLASRTAGDDWGFVHRLLSTLEKPEHGQPRHLVVLDAIEGFETLVGDLNAFGEKSTRRSRIAQVMRLAAGKCHLVFVVEEGRNQRFPEEFVTDVVLRLRNVEVGRYLRRTVEIEKARGQSHVRGQHPFVIRDGKGSSTGNQRNADEPEVPRHNSNEHQSYVHVFSSLHLASRERMIDRNNPREHEPASRFAAFGIQYLDNMLGGRGEKALLARDGSDTRGLPCGWATALIGDSLTQKTQLGMAFLSRAFYPFAQELAHRIVEAAEGCEKIKADDEREAEIRKNLRRPSVAGHQATVMFTTRVVDSDELADRFHEWLEGSEATTTDYLPAKTIHIKTLLGTDCAKIEIFKSELKKHVRQFAICRRFEIHDISAPVLMHIFQRNIETAQRLVLGLEPSDPLPGQEDLFQSSWRIRVLIDDLNSFRNTFPEMRDDPLMLPSLLAMLAKEGVTTLIIDTQTSGSPELPITERFDSSVRELVKNRIYVWRLPFYGENRVAISIIPPISHEYRGAIRELRWETKDESTTDRSTVDPHFELYAGLEQGQPQPVPLEVRLYAETPNFKKYIETEERFFQEVFTPVHASSGRGDPSVIKWGGEYEYDALRDSCHLQRDTRIDHTTILQVDEFWWLRRTRQNRAGAFRQEGRYLSAATATREKESFRPDLVVDPFEIFQPPPTRKDVNKAIGAPQEPAPRLLPELKRFHFFDRRCGYKLDPDESDEIAEQERNIDRVPFTWDFGFLLCNGKAWEQAFHRGIGKDPWLFKVDDFTDPNSVLTALKSDLGISEHLRAQFCEDTKRALDEYPSSDQTRLLSAVADELNKVLIDGSLYDKKRFAGVDLSEASFQLLAREQVGSNRERLNRMLLQDAYPGIAQCRMTVKDVWEALRTANDEGPGPKTPISWREFLGASKIVAEFQSYRQSTPATTFDLTMLMPETFSCLILEMWLSEAHSSLTRHEHRNKDHPKLCEELKKKRNLFIRRVRERRWSWDEKLNPEDVDKKLRPANLLRVLQKERDKTLEEILRERTNADGVKHPHLVKGYSLELYKVWLLLLEALNFPELVDSSSNLNFEFKPRDASPQAVCSRHWYKTASKFTDSLTAEQLEYNWIPVRVPGHFSVRADWFLAVAAGSRSNRLADHALDLLSSRRANVTRLQEGIGLPTRELFDKPENREESKLRTRLMCSPKKGEPRTNVEYEKFRKLGAGNENQLPNEEEFYWLWRSGIWAYNRHSRIWQKWLNRTLLWWHSLRQRYGSNWTSSFELYDLLNDIEFSNDKDLVAKRWNELRRLDLKSWKEFHELRNILIAELEQVSISEEGLNKPLPEL